MLLPQFCSQIKTFDRWEINFEKDSNVTSVKFLKPDGTTETVETFIYQPAVFEYNDRGYETVIANGDVQLVARYTPDVVGNYKFTVYCGNEAIFIDEFYAEQGDWANSYIGVSQKDARYFALSNGDCFFPIAANIIRPDSFPAASGTEFGRTNKEDTIGLKQYEWWFKQFAKNGGNFVRLWLSTPYFNVETDDPSEFDYLQFTKLDEMVKLAKKYSIRLKFTFDYFRVFAAEKTENAIFCKTLKYKDKVCKSGSEWINSELWQGFWFKKINEYIKRYAGDTTVFCFELWNEMNCFDATFEEITEFTARALSYLHEKAPKNMSVNSLGSFDYPAFTKWLDAFKMDEMSFQQLHRYLDQGAKLEVVRKDPIALIKDGLQYVKRPDKPFILAETGAVNDCHSSYFRYYSFDHNGIILTDVTYAPFFFESASTGQIWHWSYYIDNKNLWKYYAPIADMVKGENLDEQGLKSNDLSNDKAWILLLEGENNTYGYIKNKELSWYNVIRDMNDVNALDAFEVPVKSNGKLTVYNIWNDEDLRVELKNNKLLVSNLVNGILFKIKK